MPEIKLLDKHTIDKIAAGEVVDRPSSVVKELVENAIDAKSTAVTVEIKEGGIALIRITDNGCGIEKEQLAMAFCRHSTSKIRSVDDLLFISSLGFRGEALSSIASVSQVEVITKPAEQLTGTRYLIEGGEEKSIEDIGAPNGTTFLIKNLFYNTPARRKFLKTPQTEGGYISDLMERLALSNPEVSFKFINNGQVKLHTSGNGNLRDIIYQIYGRDITANLLEVNKQFEHFSVTGYIGKPIISRGNRNYESYFVNGRYVKSNLLSKAIEDAYKGFMMQHKFPFTVLKIQLKSTMVDVNVHPAKMELRFSNGEELYWNLMNELQSVLKGKELIPRVTIDPQRKEKPDPATPVGIKTEAKKTAETTSPSTKLKDNAPVVSKFQLEKIQSAIGNDSPYERKYDTEKIQPVRSAVREATAYPSKKGELECEISQVNELSQGKELSLSDEVLQIKEVPQEKERLQAKTAEQAEETLPVPEDRKQQTNAQAAEKTEDFAALQEPVEQLKLQDVFQSEHKLLDQTSVPYHKIIGQLFDTYWLVEFEEQLYMIDQHAAHEKVLYERTIANYKKKEFTSQYVSPPIILSLTMQEEVLLKRYLPQFQQLGFEIEPFGGKEYAIRAVPDNLYGLNGQDLVLELMDNLGSISEKEAPEMVLEKVASMSCKAAVKGNQRLSRPEIESLIGELLTLENPYHCPHGRPVIVSMSKREIEKKFKRIL